MQHATLQAAATVTLTEIPISGPVPTVVDRAVRRSQRHLLGVGELPPRDIFRILLLRPNHRLGNTLLLTPLLTELEQRYRPRHRLRGCR